MESRPLDGTSVVSRGEAKTLTRSIHFVSVKDGGGTRDTEGLVESLFKKEPAKGMLSVFFDRVENLSLSSLAGFDSIDFVSSYIPRLVRCLLCDP